MTTRKLLSKAMSRLEWFDRLEALGMEYEEALYLFHDRLASSDDDRREEEFRRIERERADPKASDGPLPELFHEAD